MELFAKPKVTTLPDGSLRIDIQKVTRKYVDKRIRIITAFQKVGYDINPIVEVFQSANSEEEIFSVLVNRFGFTHEQAEGVANMTIEDLMHYKNENIFASELDWLTVLRRMVV